MDQVSHLWMTAGKTIALTMQTFVRKVMSLLFNMPSMFVIALDNHPLILWFQSTSAVILELKKRISVTASNFSHHPLILWFQSTSAVILVLKKRISVTVSNFSPAIYHEVMGPDAVILVFCLFVLFFNVEF